MSKVNKWFCVLIYLVFSTLFAANSSLAGGGSGVAPPETNTTSTSNTGTASPANTASTSNTGTASDLNTNAMNQTILPYPASTFSSSSSFSGSSYYGSQCGLSISAGYINNGNQNAIQLLSTYNTNPCTNQGDMEKLRQENESKRELIRANAQVTMTCINARVQAVHNNTNPDMICKLTDSQSNLLPPQKSK